MRKKKIRLKKSFTPEELDMMYEALSLYMAGGARMTIGFFDSETDEMLDKEFFEGKDDALEFLESGDGYLRPFPSNRPEHVLTPQEKAQIMMILQHIAEVQVPEDDGDVRKNILSDEACERVAKENISGLVDDLYKMLREKD